MSSSTKYDTLEVGEDADQREIRAAYRRLAMKHHPDKGGDTAEFQRIQDAYETLGDEDARKLYDRQLRNPELASQMAGGHHEYWDDDSLFEEFINFSFFTRGGPPRSGSWFFDFNMSDEEYFSHYESHRAQRREERHRFAEKERQERKREQEYRERRKEQEDIKRKAAKEQQRAMFQQQQQDKKQNTHKKNMRKNLLKVITKEVPELQRTQVEDLMEKMTIEEMEDLRINLDNLNSTARCDCVANAMRSCGIKPDIKPAKTSSKKPSSVASTRVENNKQAPTNKSCLESPRLSQAKRCSENVEFSDRRAAKDGQSSNAGVSTSAKDPRVQSQIRDEITMHLLDMGFPPEICEASVERILNDGDGTCEAALEIALQLAGETVTNGDSSNASSSHSEYVVPKRSKDVQVRKPPSFVVGDMVTTLRAVVPVGPGYLSCKEGQNLVLKYIGSDGDEEGWCFAALANDGASEGWIALEDIFQSVALPAGLPDCVGPAAATLHNGRGSIPTHMTKEAAQYWVVPDAHAYPNCKMEAEDYGSPSRRRGRWRSGSDPLSV